MNKSNIWEVAKVIIISVLLATIVRTFIIQPFAVRGASMNPNFSQGDYLIIDKINYHMFQPKRGDVIVFRAPNQVSTTYYIKRIIALPGETMRIGNNQITIFNQEYPNGLVLDESFYQPINGDSSNIEKMLPDDKYFVLGDNRKASSDSRSWGLLDKDNIIGRVLIRAWPVNHLGVFASSIEY